MAYLDTKEHKEWSKAVRDRDGECLICGKKEKLSAHHLIPKEFKETRSQLMNGVALCFTHHMRFGYGISPHSHGSLLFTMILKEKRPDLWNWVKENWDGL